MKLDEALGLFVVQLRADGRSPHTIAQYERHVRVLARWAEENELSADIAHFRHDQLAEFIGSPPVRLLRSGAEKRAASVNALRTSIRCFFSYLCDVELLAKNPARRIRLARCGSAQPRSISEAQLEHLLSLIANGEGPAACRDLAMVKTLADTGMRVGSALALKIGDLDLSNRRAYLRRAKGGASQLVLLTKGLCAHLDRYLQSRTDGPVFPGFRSQSLSRRQAARRFAIWRSRARLPASLTLHSLRHRFAMNLYQRTGDLLLVQRALGHRSIVSTTIYLESDDSKLLSVLEP